MAEVNILLVVLDSVRARNCSLYGHDNETTPRLSELAGRDRVTVFDQARAPSIHSVASHASIFSGYHVPEHGVTEHESSLDPAANVFSELATDYGFDTGLFSPNLIVTGSSNLGEGFGTVVGPKRDTDQRLFANALTPADVPGDTSPVEYLRAAVLDDRPVRSVLNGFHDQLSSGTGLSQDPERESASRYIDELVEWIDDVDGSWAACLNLMDAHYPFVPQAEYDRWAGDGIAAIHDELVGEPLARSFLGGRPWGQLRAIESLYDGCIRQTDAAVSRLVTELGDRGELDETLVVVTSDHGEGFGERSHVTPEVRLVGHSWGIHEALTHVPLVVFEPTSTEDPASDTDRMNAAATLTRFPDAVRNVVEGDPATEAFVSPEGPVLSSTYRVRPPGEELPLEPGERDPFFGPWQAVYRQGTDGLTKLVSHRGDGARIHVRDAQVSYRIDSERDGSESAQAAPDGAASAEVEERYADLDDAGVAVGDASERTVDDETEDRLEELGYLR